MAENSKIEWTDHTANFWWGCVKVSPGCKHCYAETLSIRYGKNIWGPAQTTQREYKKEIWKTIPKWNETARNDGQRYRVFVQSMSDFFEDHPQVSEWRQDALSIMGQCQNLDFQVLTKRPENIIRMVSERHFAQGLPPNIWIGTSVENQEQADIRIPHLMEVSANVRFLSIEPLLGPIDFRQVPKLNRMGADISSLWVIVGGESGQHARPMHPDWARSIRNQCGNAGVPFFFKQWGEWFPAFDSTSSRVHEFPDGERMFRIGKGAAGRLLDGVEHNELPL